MLLLYSHRNHDGTSGVALARVHLTIAKPSLRTVELDRVYEYVKVTRHDTKHGDLT